MLEKLIGKNLKNLMLISTFKTDMIFVSDFIFKNQITVLNVFDNEELSFHCNSFHYET